MAGLKAVFSSGWSSELPSLPVQDTIQAPGPASLFWVPNLVKLSTKFPDSTGYCPDSADGQGQQLGSPKCHCNQNDKVGNTVSQELWLGFLLRYGWQPYSTLGRAISLIPCPGGAAEQAPGWQGSLFGDQIRQNSAPSSLAKWGYWLGSADGQSLALHVSAVELSSLPGATTRLPGWVE